MRILDFNAREVSSCGDRLLKPTIEAQNQAASSSDPLNSGQRVATDTRLCVATGGAYGDGYAWPTAHQGGSRRRTAVKEQHGRYSWHRPCWSYRAKPKACSALKTHATSTAT
jgi:hypothetical protein